MSVTAINYLNIALMLLSCGLAFVLPFELFLFSYALLGPLHYLTEISWLHKRQYFTKGNNDFKWLLLLGLLCFVGYLLHNPTSYRTVFHPFLEWFGLAEEAIINTGTFVFGAFTITAFTAALSMVLFQGWKTRLTTIILTLILAILLNGLPFYTYLIGFLPTLLHVIVFTGIFMLYGALKDNSPFGYIAVFIFLLCLSSFFWIPYTDSAYKISMETWNSYTSTGVQFLKEKMAVLAGFITGKGVGEYNASESLMFSRLIAFGYTYHYLNWFSKTSIIGWHKIPRHNIITIAVLWLAAVALYGYSYEIGVIALIGLSLLHVFFEFPLNHRSIIGVVREIGRKLGTTAEKPT